MKLSLLFATVLNHRTYHQFIDIISNEINARVIKFNEPLMISGASWHIRVN